MIHPIGLVALLVCCYVILFSRREAVITALLVLLFAIPSAQRVVILSLDFSFIRIAILAGLLRAIVKGDTRSFRLSTTDKVAVLWMFWGLISYFLLYGNIQALVTRTGYMIEAVGAYFIGRIYVRSWNDMRKVALFIGYASVPVLALFLIERSTGKNVFSVFGGIPEITLVREGKLRCQGPFSHPIMAGLFWATILPWLAVLWARNDYKKHLLLLFIISSILIIINTASSTPTMAIILCAMGLSFFPYRRLMPMVRWTFIIGLIAAQILMEKGAAHLIARANIVGGSTGWHRYYLIDESINHFNEWWLVGTWSTRHWGLGLQDVTNQYILEGVRSGFLGMLIFIVFIFSLFNKIGESINKSKDNNDRWIFWGSGVVLFIHLFSFLSAAYFGQMVASFFLFCGMIASLTETTDAGNEPQIIGGTKD